MVLAALNVMCHCFCNPQEEDRLDATTHSHNSSHPIPCPPHRRPGTLHTHNNDTRRPTFCSTPYYPTSAFEQPLTTPNSHTPFFTVFPHHVNHAPHPSWCPLPHDSSPPGSHLTTLGSSPYPHLQVCSQPAPYVDYWSQHQPPYSNASQPHNVFSTMTPKMMQAYNNIPLPSLPLSSPL